MEGWIKLHREFLKWEWFTDSHTVHVFIYLLLNANHCDGKWKGKEIKRGQLITGRDSISKATNISAQSVRTSLKRLKSTSEITIESTNKNSLITIVKWDFYQKITESSTRNLTSNLTNNQPATNQQLTTNNNVNNKKNEEEEKNLSLSTAEKKKSILNFDFVEDRFKCFLKFVEYRRERGLEFQQQQVVEASYKQMIQYSKNDPSVAEMVVNTAIAAEAKKLFPLEDRQKEVKKNNLFGAKNF